jgi:GxxExxY protein
MRITKKYLDDLTYRIIGCAIEVHKFLGPGLLESTYLKCFCHELSIKNIDHLDQIAVPLNYKGLQLETEFRLDSLVQQLVVVELKAMDGILPVHEAQLLTYMKLLQKPKGVLINFNCLNIFQNGQKTFVNEYYANLPDV